MGARPSSTVVQLMLLLLLLGGNEHHQHRCCCRRRSVFLLVVIVIALVVVVSRHELIWDKNVPFGTKMSHLGHFGTLGTSQILNDSHESCQR